MKTRTFITTGMLALALTFGLVLAGCATTGESGTPSLPEAAPDPEAAAKLAADINAIKAGSATAEGATVKLTSRVELATTLTVPVGATLDVTAKGASLSLRNETLTVNGVVLAKSGGIGMGNGISVINGSGTIRLQGKGRLINMGGDKEHLTLDGVTLVGIKYNNDVLVKVSTGGTLVMKSGAIMGNMNTKPGQGGGLFVADAGTTFTLEGGTIYGKDAPDGKANKSPENTSAIMVHNGTANWGTSGTYTKGGVPQTGGSAITSTDETLIATP